MPAIARKNDAAIQDERLTMVGVALRWLWLAMLVLSPLGALALWRAGSAFALAWGASYAVIALSCLVGGYVMRESERRWSPALREGNQVLQMLLAGGGWGLIVLILPLPIEMSAQVMAFALMCPAALLACALLCASRSGFFSFLIALAAPLIWQSERLHLPLGGSGLVLILAALILLHDLAYRSVMKILRQRKRSEYLAREQDMIFDTATEGILLVRDGRIVKSNRCANEMFRESPVGSRFGKWHVDRLELDGREDELRAAPIGSRFSYVTTLRCADGHSFWAEISARAGAEDEAAGVVWVVSDISERREIESALQLSERRFRSLLALSSDWFWEQDANFRFTDVAGVSGHDVADAAARSLGKCRWELDGIDGVSDAQWTAHRASLAAHEAFEDFVYRVRATEGLYCWISVSGQPVFDDKANFLGYQGVSKDVSLRVAQAEQIRYQAQHDALTGLPNRRVLQDRLEQAMGQARRNNRQVALMLLDLDDFKTINDNEGHAAGDAVLVTVAERLRQAVRDSDSVARIGGDEFVVLLPDMADAADAESVAEKIGAAIREPMTAGRQEYVLGVSIGIAVFPPDGQDAERLMSLADAAMYRCKRAGGGYVFAQSPGQRALDFFGGEAACHNPQ